MKKSMRKIYSVILVLAMVIGLFPMGTVEAKANTTSQGNVSYEPLQLSKEFLTTNGGNGVGTKTDYESAEFYPDHFFFYDKGYADTYRIGDGWMPESGAIEVGGVPYKFADYEGNDCILLNSTKKSETLKLETIGVYDKVYVLATGGGVGSSTSVLFNVTLNYTDGTTKGTTYYLKDWYPSSVDKNTMYTDIKRVEVDSGNGVSGSTDGGPVIQTSALDVDETRLLESITFTYPDNDERLFCAVFGVTGATPPGVPDAPTAKAAAPGKAATTPGEEPTVFVANWEAPKNQGASEVTSYFIDIATDINFTNILEDYNNENVGNCTSYEVKSSTLDPDATYYYRVRAKNTQGQSISSNRVATALPEWLGVAMDPDDHSKVTYDLDTNTATFDDSVVLVDTIKVPNGENISICVPEGKTVTGAENKPAISVVSGTGETVSLNVYGGGTIKGGKGSDEDVTAGTPAKPGQPAIDFSQAKGTATLVVGKTTDDTTKIIGGNGGNSTTAAGGDGGAGIYLSGNSTMQEKGTTDITGGKGGTGVNENSKGKAGIPVLREFSSSAITATPYNGTYDGYAHGIYVSVPSGATVTYSLTENGEYTTTKPTRTDATGEQPVTVYYKVEKEGYVPVKGFATITISSRGVSYLDITNNNVAYTGNPVVFSSIYYDGVRLVEGEDYVIVGGTKTGTNFGEYTLTIEGKGNFSDTREIKWNIKDLTAPTGKIEIVNSDKNWNSLIGTGSILFDIFYNAEQTIKITAEDFGSEVDSIKYYISGRAMDLSELESTFRNYGNIYDDEPVTVHQIGKYIVYAQITDEAGNVTYISTNGIVVDNQAPVFDGIEDEMSSNADSIEFTVTDNFGLEKVLIDGKEVTPVNGKYKVNKSYEEQTITAIDKAGNKTTIKVLVHGDRTAPIGMISIDDEYKWSSTPNGEVYVFFNEAQKITIEAIDNGIGLDRIEYMIVSGPMYSDDSNEAPEWKEYTGPFTVEPDKTFVIYAKLIDKADNTAYIVTDYIVLDATAPVISGIVNGKVYCDDKVQFTVEDEYFDYVLINGEVAETDENGYYNVTVGEDVQVIKAVDMSGNVTTYEITVNGCHTWKEPVVTWAEDELSAKFDFVCKYDETHTYTKEVQATLEIEDGATGSQKGTITHVVKVELDGKVYTAKQVNDTPVVEEEKVGEGKLTAKVEVAEDVPEVVVDDLDVDLVKDLLTEEQLESVEADGSQIEVSLKIETLKDAAPEVDVKLVKDTLATIVKDLTVKNDYVSTEEVKSGIEYIDLSLYMKIDDNPEEKISQLKGKELTITMEIPENIKSDKKGRQYYVIRVHDGSEVEVLDSVIDLVAGTIQFKTDRFSTYAIVYTDVTDAEVNVPELPKTADSSDVELFVLTFVAGVYMIVCAEKKRRA